MNIENNEVKSLNFIEEIIEHDNETGKHNKRVLTRFPPEPNGFLHIGHAKSICLNFGLGKKYSGATNLRFDDTNPTTEKVDYVNSIQNDVRWLGFEWDGEVKYASDYFENLYTCAQTLIKKGLAYVDFSSPDDIAKQKGTPTQAGTGNAYRETSAEENLSLFEKMRKGEFKDGECVLRAKIDMASPNMLLRDPVIYRIKRAHHHRTGDNWCIYPMYDFAHPISDALEGITHSICTLEFEPHRPFYEWLLAELGLYNSQQIEFARLNLTYTVMSKRKMLKLVEKQLVNSWDDPRMPTISGMRRRGYTAKAIRDFAVAVGISKRESMLDVSLLEHFIREDLNKISKRVMAVIDPIKVVISNYETGKTELLPAENNPEDSNAGHRELSFSNTIFIEREDFNENPPKGYFKLTPNGYVRLKHAYIIKCEELIKDENGNLVEIRASYVENSKSGSDTSGLKVKGVIHWVDANNYHPVQINWYDRLLTIENAADIPEDEEFTDYINPNSLKTITAWGEKSLADAKAGEHFQFMRKGYFCVDTESAAAAPIFNLTVELKDSWAKELKKQS